MAICCIIPSALAIWFVNFIMTQCGPSIFTAVLRWLIAVNVLFIIFVIYEAAKDIKNDIKEAYNEE